MAFVLGQPGTQSDDGKAVIREAPAPDFGGGLVSIYIGQLAAHQHHIIGRMREGREGGLAVLSNRTLFPNLL